VNFLTGAMKMTTARVVVAATCGGAIRTEESPFVASLGIEVDLQVRL
jgi:translation elongation factor EF-Tu-like GTPase